MDCPGGLVIRQRHYSGEKEFNGFFPLWFDVAERKPITFCIDVLRITLCLQSFHSNFKILPADGHVGRCKRLERDYWRDTNRGVNRPRDGQDFWPEIRRGVHVQPKRKRDDVVDY